MESRKFEKPCDVLTVRDGGSGVLLMAMAVMVGGGGGGCRDGDG